MAHERSFLDPLNEAQDMLIHAKEYLAAKARAFHAVGNPSVADDLAQIGIELDEAKRLIDEGRDRALKSYTGAVEEGTSNMVRGILAVSR